MSKVISIENKFDKNNSPMKVCLFEGDKKVFVNSKYDALIYDQVIEGSEWELVQDGQFTKIKYDKPSNNRPAGGAVKAAEITSQSVEKSSQAKTEGFKSNGSATDATSIVTTFYPEFANYLTGKEEAIKEKWEYWRKYFYDKRDEPFS